MISEIVMIIALLALGTFFYIQQNDKETSLLLGWLPLTSLIVFIAAFAIGMGALPWLMMGEIVPQKVKGPATSIATFVNWFLAFVVTLTFDALKKWLTDAGAFWLFAGCCLLGSVFCFFAVPETKGKTPDEIQAFFGNERSQINEIRRPLLSNDANDD